MTYIDILLHHNKVDFIKVKYVSSRRNILEKYYLNKGC